MSVLSNGLSAQQGVGVVVVLWDLAALRVPWTMMMMRGGARPESERASEHNCGVRAWPATRPRHRRVAFEKPPSGSLAKIWGAQAHASPGLSQAPNWFAGLDTQGHTGWPAAGKPDSTTASVRPGAAEVSHLVLEEPRARPLARRPAPRPHAGR